jgi:hypothetical protein
LVRSTWLIFTFEPEVLEFVEVGNDAPAVAKIVEVDDRIRPGKELAFFGFASAVFKIPGFRYIRQPADVCQLVKGYSDPEELWVWRAVRHQVQRLWRFVSHIIDNMLPSRER